MRCNICGSHNIELKNGKYGYWFECQCCGATVGCHRGTKKPMGIFADKYMRTLRMQCHNLFDFDAFGRRRWTTSKERNRLYRGLARELGITPERCHFGKMDKAMLEKAKDKLLEWRADGR